MGLNVLHSCGVVHRDLKSANILISAPDLVKIGDLGVSTVLHSTQLARTQIGTPLYLAPEIWKSRPYDQKCDMWSLGVLLYEMMTFTFPFLGRTTDDISRRVCLGKFQLPRGYSANLTLIVRQLLQVNPLLRPSVSDLLKTPMIQSRMHLINVYLNPSPLYQNQDHLLSTIKVPSNVKNINLPHPAYDKNIPIIRPLEERIHIKKGYGSSKALTCISSPELQIISDFDLWSPTKNEKIENQEKENNLVYDKVPVTHRNPIPALQPMIPKFPNPRVKKPAYHNPRRYHVPYI